MNQSNSKKKLFSHLGSVGSPRPATPRYINTPQLAIHSQVVTNDMESNWELQDSDHTTVGLDDDDDDLELTSVLHKPRAVASSMNLGVMSFYLDEYAG